MLTLETHRTLGAVRIDFGSRDAWVASRSALPWPIGASDAAKNACGMQCAVWVEKKLGQKLDAAAMPWLELGHCLEPAILEACRRIHGWTIEPFPQDSTLRHPSLDWVRCTPDAFRLDGDEPEPINAKNVSLSNPRYSDFRDGFVAEDHSLGAQWEMLVTGAKRAWIVVLLGGQEVIPFPVERDDVAIDGLLDTCAEFRERYLIGDEEPTPDGDAATARALARRAKYEPGSRIVLDGDAAQAAIELAELEEKAAELAEPIAQRKNVIRQRMKDAQIGLAPTGAEYYWTKGESPQLRKRGSK